jgi:hypothetical protein
MREERRWIADEMLGKLARYLRFLGYDVVYARGWTDRMILDRSAEQGRTILTRDELLATRAKTRAILLRAFDVEKQLVEIKKAYPFLREEVSFVRCSICNGPLALADRSTPEPPKGVPANVWASPGDVHICSECGQPYWEGSHTKEIRKVLERTFHGSG